MENSACIQVSGLQLYFLTTQSRKFCYNDREHWCLRVLGNGSIHISISLTGTHLLVLVPKEKQSTTSKLFGIHDAGSVNNPPWTFPCTCSAEMKHVCQSAVGLPHNFALVLYAFVWWIPKQPWCVTLNGRTGINKGIPTTFADIIYAVEESRGLHCSPLPLDRKDE